MSRILFELRWAKVAERGVQTLTIVPSFDVLEDGGAGMSACVELFIGAFGLEGTEKAFHGGIVKTVSTAAHADLAMISGQVLQIGFTGVLAALVRMMQQVRRRIALCDRHVPGFLHQRSFHVLVHGPSHHPS